MRGSVVHDLVRRAGNISVHVIAGDERGPCAKTAVQTAARQEPFDPRPYLMALLFVAIGLGAAMLIQPMFGGIENVDLVFLTAVVGVAVRYGLWPSLLASVAASLCYNFFFLPPVYTFTITDPTNVAAFFFFMLIAILVSNVAARVRTQADTAIGRVRTTESLYAFSRKLAGTATLDDVLWATAYQTALMLKVRVVLLLPEDGVLTVKAGYPPEDRTRRGRSRRRELGLEQRSPGRARLGHAAGRQAAVPADADRARRDRRHRHRRRQDRPAADAGPAPPAGCAGRSGRAGDRAGAAGRGHGPRQAHGGIRPAARRAADLDLARSEDAAGLRARRRLHPARSRRRPQRRAEERSARHHDRRIRAAQPLHRQSARHDQARIRRHRAEHRAARCRRDRRQRAAARRQDPRASQGVAGARPPICRCWSSMPCCSSRCCSTCSTTPRNMRRPAPRFRSGARAIRE